MKTLRSNSRSRWQQMLLPSDVARTEVRNALVGVTGGGGYESTRATNRATWSWPLSGGSADADTLPSLDQLRQQSRDLTRNNPLAAGAINTNVTSVVGTGLRPKPSIDRRILGLTDEQKDAWERMALHMWRVATAGTNMDVSGRQSFAGQQQLVVRSTLENGDTFVIRRFVERPGSVFGIRLQLVEGDRCCNPRGVPDTERLVSGVEMDANGMPTNYHFRSRHPGDLFMRFDQDSKRVPARSESGQWIVKHLYHMRRIDQTRGIPYLAPVISQLKQLSRYTEAELMATVVSSLYTVFITTQEGDSGSLSAPQFPAGTAAGNAGVGWQDDNPEAIELKSGMVMDLAPGEKPEFANPGRPNQAFDPFVQAILRQIGVSLEIPFEILIKHFTASYSASRAALMEAWRYFRTHRHWLVEHFCQPVYEMVMAEAVARGLIEAPGFFDDPIIRHAWLGCDWFGDSMGQLDPLREAKAAEVLLNNELTTRSRLTSEMTGQDWDHVHDQSVRENTLRQTDGLLGPDEADTEGLEFEDQQEFADAYGNVWRFHARTQEPWELVSQAT